ncbi:MAG TPA: HAMP domain-containing protein, partial [Verrucomicrobiae bacterium]|nr:HAMP domain-containing protein [Verrucomicrobiae bacterium]
MLRVAEKIRWKLSGFGLIRKLVLSYALMGFFTGISVIITLVGLQGLNRTAVKVGGRHLAAITAANDLRESLKAQEGFAAKFFILRSPEYRRLFEQRGVVSTRSLELLSGFGDRGAAEASEAYAAFTAEAAGQMEGKRARSDEALRRRAGAVSALAEQILDRERGLLEETLREGEAHRRKTVSLTLFLAFSGFLVATAVAVFFIMNISGSFRKLRDATHRIAAGDFDYDPHIPPGDEFGELAADFTGMAAKLKVLEEMSLDASPLTRLPGNLAIERALDHRLRVGEPFAVCYADLDNFKAYNDRYGYVRASEAIKMTATVIRQAVNEKGDPRAFVGHIGGDDFVMILSSESISGVCEKVIDDFTCGILPFYTNEDLRAGAIRGKDRYGVEREFPIMTISIAVLECAPGEYSSAAEVAHTVAETKERAKSSPGS